MDSKLERGFLELLERLRKAPEGREQALSQLKAQIDSTASDLDLSREEVISLIATIQQLHSRGTLDEYLDPPQRSMTSFNDLRPREACYLFDFLDDDCCVPDVQTFVYIGKNLRVDDVEAFYFQDRTSFQGCVAWNSEDALTMRQMGSERSIFLTFEEAKSRFDACALKRAEPRNAAVKESLIINGQKFEIKRRAFLLDFGRIGRPNTCELDYISNGDLCDHSAVAAEAIAVCNAALAGSDHDDFIRAIVNVHEHSPFIGAVTREPTRLHLLRIDQGWAIDSTATQA